MAATEQVDQRALEALKKRRSGAKLTQADERAIKRYETELRQRYGRAFISELPKKDYLAAAGVSNKVMLEQADRLDLPWRPHDKTVDGWAMLARFHALFVEHAQGIYKLIRHARNKSAVEEFFPDDQTDWQEECWKERALELRDKRTVREGSMLDSAAHAQIMGRVADSWRDFGERLGKRFGPEAQQMFLEVWRDIESDVSILLDDDDGSSSPSQTA